jgi:hypothetical protein
MVFWGIKICGLMYFSKPYCVGFEVLTSEVMKFSSIFCDVTPCSPVKATDVSEEHVASIRRAEE